MPNNNDLNSYNVHDHLKDHDLETLRNINMQERLDFAVCLINLRGDLNIGMIIRSACLLGAEKIIVVGKRKFDRRSCVGSQNYIPIDKVGEFNENGFIDPELFNNTMLENNYTPVFIETGGQTIDNFNVSTLPASTKPCLVLGCEGKGINPVLMENSQHIYSIPQMGVLRSFNVSSAAAIAMWEMHKALK